jgi:hypothetical protein
MNLGDDLLLVTLHPGGKHDEQGVQDHDFSSCFRAWRERATQYTPIWEEA